MSDGSIDVHEKRLIDLLETAKKQFVKGIELERKRREEAEKQRAESVVENSNAVFAPHR